MCIEIPSELTPYVQDCSDHTGKPPGEIVGEALRLHQELDRRRQALREAIREGINSGNAIPGDDIFRDLYEQARVRSDPCPPE